MQDCKSGSLVTNPQNFNHILVTGQVAQGAKKCMGIVFSKNGGTSWTPARINDQDGSSATVAAIAPSNANILYVGGVDSAWKALIYRSTNGGASWTAITNGISYQPQAIAVDPQDPNIAYVATYSEIMRSSNGGGSWTKSTFPSSTWGFKAVAVNKNNPNQVFAGCSRGVFYSQDRGLTWTDISQGLIIPYVNQLYFNPTTSTLYVGTEGGGLYKRKFLKTHPAKIAIDPERAAPAPVAGPGRKTSATLLLDPSTPNSL